MYPAEIVIPMKEELTENGFNELLSPEAVDAFVVARLVPRVRVFCLP
ncbi:MAG: disulfide isomerase [Bacteroidota bacterium]